MVNGNPVGGNGRGEGFDGRDNPEFHRRMDSLRRKEEEAKRRQV